MHSLPKDCTLPNGKRMCIAKRWVKLSYVDNFFDEGSVLNFLFVVVFFFDFVYYVGDDFDADYKEINK